VENPHAHWHCGKVVIVANVAAEVIAGDATNSDYERSAGFYQYYQVGADDGDDAPQEYEHVHSLHEMEYCMHEHVHALHKMFLMIIHLNKGMEQMHNVQLGISVGLSKALMTQTWCF
jgi:hypothetical protein